MIQFISSNYKESEVCLNEMGAAWVLDVPVIPFILEPVTYNTVGFIHSTDQQLRIHEKSDLLKFVSELKALFNHGYNDNKLHRKIDDFLTAIKPQ